MTMCMMGTKPGALNCWIISRSSLLLCVTFHDFLLINNLLWSHLPSYLLLSFPLLLTWFFSPTRPPPTLMTFFVYEFGSYVCIFSSFVFITSIVIFIWQLFIVLLPILQFLDSFHPFFFLQYFLGLGVGDIDLLFGAQYSLDFSTLASYESLLSLSSIDKSKFSDKGFIILWV